MAAVVAAAALMLSGCVVRGLEAQLLERFFSASRLYDRAALSTIATVVFNPVTDGIVQEFEVLRVEAAGERRRVTIAAPVRRRDGSISNETLTATIERRDGRWLVTAITPLRASQTSPAASSARPN